ncbi:hypothetical protein OJAV_G00229340 [Oryzias javanicus]|uniref:DM10 domain-containing protein n=1 Tax=Oryzias javanicus TaxID=123683 RepID=A0A3S2LKD6_ORYJA|nr:hypothetical protein OJAV_G00229340 [Oryzias javanicus]
MSSPWNNKGLPFLPGSSFQDYTKSAFHQPQTLGYHNGYPVIRRLSVGIGREPHLSEQLNTTAHHLRELSFPSSDRKVYESFVPAYVVLDKKVLRFNAFFKEEILHSSSEEYRVRPVVICYYLEDDTMEVVEPRVENSGLEQGTRLTRHKIPKNDQGQFYLWKDLNIGMDLKLYGCSYHITQCDAFTKEFMESEGILLNEPEPTPEDPYIKKRKVAPNPNIQTQPPTSSRLKQFLTMDGKVLSFFALMREDSKHQHTFPVTIHYFLVDDTVEVREAHKDRRQISSSVLMARLKIPKKMKPGAFPSCVVELSHLDVDEYYSPRDFQLGQTVTLLARSYLLCDCDNFTKKYYQENHPDMEMKPLEAPEKFEIAQKEKLKASAAQKVPPKVEKNLENHHKVLRYKAKLDSPYPEDQDRSFVFIYSLFDKTISIFEKALSTLESGVFLRNVRVPKPGSTEENPEFYSPDDFAIGATLEVFSHRFILTDADLYVLKYLESISDQVSSQTLDSLRQKLSAPLNDSQ